MYSGRLCTRKDKKVLVLRSVRPPWDPAPPLDVLWEKRLLKTTGAASCLWRDEVVVITSKSGAPSAVTLYGRAATLKRRGLMPGLCEFLHEK